MFNIDWITIHKRVALFSDEDATSYNRLIALLKAPVIHDPDRDCHVASGIFVWLWHNIRARHEDTNPDSPLELVTNLYQNPSAKNFAEAFKKLCKEAKIECTTVEGIAKDDEFEPGELQVNKAKMKSYWNVVKIKDVWLPIHPYWCMKAMDIKETGKIACDGNTKINTFWFLTDPDRFILKCFPDDPAYQHLQHSQTIKRSRQFMQLACLTEHFYHFGLTLITENSCVTETVDGKAKIAFKANNPKSELMCHTSLKNEKNRYMDHLVFQSRKKKRFTFEVQCPETGNYQLVIYGRYSSDINSLVLLKTKIKCREPLAAYRPLLVEVGEVGWGWGTLAYKSGLKDALIKIPRLVVPKSAIDYELVTFKINKKAMDNMTFQAELITDKKSSSIQDNVKVTKDTRSGQLRIKVEVMPNEDEFVLMIEAREKNTNFEPICYYLINTVDNKESVEEYYEDSSDGMSDLDEEIERQENIRNRKQVQLNRLKRSGKDKYTSTDDLVDSTETRIVLDTSDRPLPVYIVEMFLALVAVVVAVLRMLTLGAVDKL